jgi:hypothetical protein
VRDERRGLAHATLTAVATVVVVRVARRVVVRVLLCVVVAERAARQRKEKNFGSVNQSTLGFNAIDGNARRNIQNSIESNNALEISICKPTPNNSSARVDATRRDARTHQAAEQFDPAGIVESIVDAAPFVP